MTLVICNSCIIHMLTHASIYTVTHHDVLTALYMSNVNVQTTLCNIQSHLAQKEI